MKNKMKKVFCEMSKAVFLAGIITLLIALYYTVIKSGIPYQDPTVELQIQYEINYGIGSILSKTGLILALCGAIIRLLIWRITVIHKLDGI